MSISVCPNCEQPMAQKSIKRHQDATCVLFTLGVTKQEVMYWRSGHVSPLSDVEISENPQYKQMHLDKSILEEGLADIKKKVEEMALIIKENIEQMLLLVVGAHQPRIIDIDNSLNNPRTRISYHHTLKKYKEWCALVVLDWENCKNINKFLDGQLLLGCAVTTVKKHRRILQQLFRAIVPKVRAREKHRIKYSMPPNIQAKFIMEQKANNNDLGVMCEVMCDLALRVNAAAQMKQKDIIFMTDQSHTVLIRDSKSTHDIDPSCTPSVKKSITKLLRNRPHDPEGYLFFPRLLTPNRVNTLTNRLRKALHSSAHIPKNAGYVRASHCFQIGRAS